MTSARASDRSMGLHAATTEGTTHSCKSQLRCEVQMIQCSNGARLIIERERLASRDIKLFLSKRETILPSGCWRSGWDCFNGMGLCTMSLLWNVTLSTHTWHTMAHTCFGECLCARGFDSWEAFCVPVRAKTSHSRTKWEIVCLRIIVQSGTRDRERNREREREWGFVCFGEVLKAVGKHNKSHTVE